MKKRNKKERKKLKKENKRIGGWPNQTQRKGYGLRIYHFLHLGHQNHIPGNAKWEEPISGGVILNGHFVVNLNPSRSPNLKFFLAAHPMLVIIRVIFTTGFNRTCTTENLWGMIIYRGASGPSSIRDQLELAGFALHFLGVEAQRNMTCLKESLYMLQTISNRTKFRPMGLIV